MDNLMRWLYGVLGARYPVASIVVVMIVGGFTGALVSGAAWWSMGQQYKREGENQDLKRRLDQLQVQVDDKAKRKEIRDKLSGFLQKGVTLRNACVLPHPTLTEEVNSWVMEVAAYLKEHLGDSYVVQFLVTRPRTSIVTGVSRDSQDLWHTIDQRVQTLSRFIDELK